MISVTEALLLIAAIILIWVLLKPEVLVRWGRTLGRLKAEASRVGSDDEVYRLAERLGIPTEGKTREELIEEIRNRSKRTEAK
ncbi:MAG: hypothetical protein NZ988_01640 [Thaumarchaeota archaeon]|nr:hypothetical protein [Candidatus Calditenuaceae archaeon]MDW8186737.1 hypothetical protein [Nitrososphaerota archaeon]